jgi:hypothetical protein
MSEFHVASVPVPYTYCLRVSLSLANGTVQILKVTRVAMRAPASLGTPPSNESSGFWFEVQDEKGKSLYHRPLPTAHLDSVEVFDEKSGGIRRVDNKGKGPARLELLLPDIPQATDFILHGAANASDRRKASVVLDHRRMDDLRKAAHIQPEPPGPKTSQEADDEGGAR